MLQGFYFYDLWRYSDMLPCPRVGYRGRFYCCTLHLPEPRARSATVLRPHRESRIRNILRSDRTAACRLRTTSLWVEIPRGAGRTGTCGLDLWNNNVVKTWSFTAMLQQHSMIRLVVAALLRPRVKLIGHVCLIVSIHLSSTSKLIPTSYFNWLCKTWSEGPRNCTI